MVSDLNQVIDIFVKERGVSREIIIDALETALLTVARKKLGDNYDVEAHFNEDLGEVELFRFREVVEEVDDEFVEIDVNEARKMDEEVEIGDSLGEKVDMREFGRISAQAAKQVIIQKVREAENEIIYNEYKDREGEIANGILRRYEKGNYIVDLGRTEGIVYRKDQIPRENYQIGDRIRAYILEVVRSSTHPQIILSRTSPKFLTMLFELEVPEISEGIVTIVIAAREPGLRAKIAVASRDSHVDPVGACVGMKGSRVQSVVNELRGEKIDIVPYSKNPAKFVCNALSPAEVTKVIIDEKDGSMQVVVADDQLSLAIGKKGQNVRLAVQLSGWKLDIQSETNWKEISEIARSMFARIPDIPEVAVELLIKSGYMDIEELADADPEELARFPGISPEGAELIIRVCKDILETNDWPLPEPEPKEVPETEEKDSDGMAEVISIDGETRGAGVGLPSEKISAAPEPAAGEAGADASTSERAQEEAVSPELLLDLMKLSGVGLKSAEALYRAGYRSRSALGAVTMDALLAVPDLDLEIAQKIADEAGQES